MEARMTAATQVKAKNAQRVAAKRATLQMFKDRKPYEADFELELDGETVLVSMKAIGAKDYDKLVDQCPATREQIAENASYDQTKFMPLLLSKVCQDPAFTFDEWKDIFGGTNYGRGEISELFFTAVNVCNRQLGMKLINPTGSDSE
jgi:hypothetical protein